MFFLGDRVTTMAEGKQLSKQLIDSGKALDKFREMVELQSGDPRVVDDPGLLPKAQHTLEIVSSRPGFITAIQCEQTGMACVVLGGGRERKEDSVDPSVGFVLHKKVGDKVATGETLCTVHYNSDDRAARAKTLLQKSFEVGDAPPTHQRPLVHRVITKSGEKN
jgi:thymidine phosphorylase